MHLHCRIEIRVKLLFDVMYRHSTLLYTIAIMTLPLSLFFSPNLYQYFLDIFENLTKTPLAPRIYGNPRTQLKIDPPHKAL